MATRYGKTGRIEHLAAIGKERTFMQFSNLRRRVIGWLQRFLGQCLRSNKKQIPCCAAEWKARRYSDRKSGLSYTLVAIALVGTAAAQADFEKGYQTYQSYHGSDFDTVNLANGNLVLNIPLISYEQRGGLAPIVISIRSNSSTFQPLPPYENGPQDTKQHEVASGVVGAPWGQPHVSMSPGGLSWKEERVTTKAKTAAGPEYLTRFVAIDESGATHSLGGAIANNSAGNVPGIMYSVDGSGLMLQPGTSQSGPVLVDRDGSAGGLVDTNGNAILLKGPCARPGGSGDYFDPSLPAWEGYAHGTASATSIVDSIGRVIPNPSYLPPVASYTCLLDLDASYHPAHPDANGCETWNFPAQAPNAALNGATVPFLFCYEQIPVSASIPQPNGSQLEYITINETWWALKSVTLPNSTQWVFAYDNYGQVSKVTMPTGASVQYQYQSRIACGNPPGEIPVSGTPVWPFSNVMSSRMVSKRILTVPGNANAAASTQTWSYTNTIGSGWGAGPPSTGQPNTVVQPGGPNSGTVSVLDPLLNLTVHTFTLQGAAAGSPAQGNSFCGPYETKTQYYQGQNPAASALLKEVDTVYDSLGTDYANPTNFSNYIAAGVLPAKKSTILTGTSGSAVSEEDTTYDNTPSTAFGTYQDYEGLTHPFSLGLLLNATEYDWGNGAKGPELRSIQHTRWWQSNWKYYAANLIDLPYQESVFCAACTTPSSQTTYAYDEPAYSALPGLGNATSVTHLFTAGASPATHTFYSAAGYGMPWQKQDAKGNNTQYSYDGTGLYLSKITFPNSSFETFIYDPDTGLLNSSKDVNGNPTLYSYDSMRRLTAVNYPDGGAESYCFIDLAGQTCPAAGASAGLTYPAFVFSKALFGTTSLKEAGLADGLGRLVEKQLLTDGPIGATSFSVIYTDTTYDSLGRVQSVTNPYRTTGPTSTNGTTSYAYDALGRKTIQCQPDNGTASSSCAAGSSYQAWSYNQNAVTFTDELRHPWTRTTDALGRLISVVEPTNVQTAYSYNALDDLTSVAQPGVQTRNFTYDSLSRLVTSANPETGQVCYGAVSGGTCVEKYDLNGNLMAKTDAAGNVISYNYEPVNAGLDRLLSKTYTPVNAAATTPAACYQYDSSALGGTNLTGRLTNAWTQAATCPTTAPSFAIGSSAAILSHRSFSYDKMGRILSEQQCTRTNCNTASFNPTYTYDLAGNIITHTNGVSGTGSKTFTNCYDPASRLAYVGAGSINCSSPTTPALFSGATYWPAGGLMTASYGSGLTLNRTYDSRLRILTENDQGGTVPTATGASASIQITGADQHH